MRCPSDGELRALLGGEGAPEARAHAQLCPNCRTRLAELETAAALARVRLDALGTAPAPDPVRALHTFNSKTVGRNRMMTEFGTRRAPRAAIAGGLMALMIAVGLLITPVRTAAFEMLGVLRVERFAVVTIDITKMPLAAEGRTLDRGEIREAQERLTKHERKPDLNAFGRYEGPRRIPEPQTVASLDAAESVAGYAPADAGTTLGGRDVTRVAVSSPVRASYTVDVSKIRARLDRAGMEDRVRVPQQLDGKTFTLTAERGIVVQYGAKRGGVLFAQGPSPELSIPEGVNMDYVRQDFLMIPGLPQDLVRQVRAIEDWERTLVLPVPANGASREVDVAGNEGVLISDAKREMNLVLWQRDGKLYAIGGAIGADEALEAARAVRYR